jgi:hypothetical protein
MKHRTGKTVAVLAGLALLSVILLGLLKWPELAKKYYLFRLRGDSSYVHSIIGEPEGTLAREVLRQWVREDLLGGEGIRAVREQGGGPFRAKKVDILEGDLAAVELVRFLANFTGFPTVADPRVSAKTVTLRSGVPNTDAELAVALLAAEGGRVTVETLPNQRRVLRVQLAGATSPPRSTTAESPLPEVAGARTVHILEGEIQLSELGQFLEGWTGLPVRVDSAIAGRPVTVPARIEDADGEIVRALLDVHGLAVERETGADAKQTLRIKAVAGEKSHDDER